MDGCVGGWLLHSPNHGIGLDYSTDAISSHASYVSSSAFCGAWAERFDRRVLLVSLMVSMAAMYFSLAGLAVLENWSFGTLP